VRRRRERDCEDIARRVLQSLWIQSLLSFGTEADARKRCARSECRAFAIDRDAYLEYRENNSPPLATALDSCPSSSNNTKYPIHYDTVPTMVGDKCDKILEQEASSECIGRDYSLLIDI
jgi:hypothetical protein